MDREVLPGPLLTLLAIIGILWLATTVWRLASYFTDIFMLFFLAWLIAFTLSPLAKFLSSDSPPKALASGVGRLGADKIAKRLQSRQLPRSGAVALIYLILALLLSIAGLFVVPLIATQLSQLGSRLPRFVSQAPTWPVQIENELQARGIEIDLSAVAQYQDLTSYAQTWGSWLAQNALTVATGIASIIADFFLVLILSFYMMLDGPRFLNRCLEVIPARYRDEAVYFVNNVDHTFGGFVRGQSIMAVLSGIGTAVVMWWAGLGFVTLTSLLAGAVILIPFLGAPVALLLPVVVALFQDPTQALWIGIALLGWQQLILHILMPRIMSQAVGLHPLLVFAALLFGVRAAGFWGALFGIPVVAVMYAMAAFFFERGRQGMALTGDYDPTVEQSLTATEQETLTHS